MGAREALDLTRGQRHAREKQRAVRWAEDQAAAKMRKHNQEVKRVVRRTWVQEFGDLDHEPTPEEVIRFSIVLRMALRSKFEDIAQDFEELEQQVQDRGNRLGHRLAREKLEVLTDG